MCLAVPAKVVEIRESSTALVETMGVRRLISLDLLQEEVKEGDYVLVHVGFAIQKLREEEVEESLRIFEEILRSESVPDV